MFHIKRFLITWFFRPIFIRLGISRFSKPGLNNLDEKLAPYLNIRNGFFVELGANDGIRQSNTFYLEKLKGWKGVLIEPIPRLYDQAKKNRKSSQVVNAACVSFDFDQSFIEIADSGLMSFVDGALKPEDVAKQIEFAPVTERLQVEARTLNDILISCGVQHIDFLSLDVEGYEAEVLRGLDLERFQPVYVLIEARYRDDVEAVISPYYDVVNQFSDNDVLYKRKRYE